MSKRRVASEAFTSNAPRSDPAAAIRRVDGDASPRPARTRAHAIAPSRPTLDKRSEFGPRSRHAAAIPAASSTTKVRSPVAHGASIAKRTSLT
jgi:hypothetical protein